MSDPFSTFSDTSGLGASDAQDIVSGADTSNLFSNLGDALSGGGSGSPDLSTLAAALFGGGGGSAPTVNSPSQAANAVTQSAGTSFTNDIAAAQAAPQTTPSGAQGQGQGQGQGDNQFAPQSAVDQLKRALTGLKQMQRQNPWQTGGGVGAQEAGQNSSMLNRAARIPPPQPAQRADPMQTQGQGGYDPTAVMGDEGPGPQDPTQVPPWWRWAGGRPYTNDPPRDPNQVTDIPDFRRPPTPTPSSPVQPPAPDEATFPQQPPSPGLGGLAGLARMATPLTTEGMAASAIPLIASTTPAETGEAPTNAWFQRPSGVGGGPDTSVARAPETGKPVETVDPKTKEPVNPKTGDPIAPGEGGREDKAIDPRTGKPFKVRDKSIDPKTGKPWILPTKKPHDETAPPPGPIIRDVGGQQGVPQLLGSLARMALPLILSGLMGGMGGRRGGFRGGRGFGGFRGGFRGRGFPQSGHFHGLGGHWPYHSPTQGWGIHGGHPGGDWRPMSPRHMREFMGGGGGGGALGYGGDGGGLSTGNPQLDQLLGLGDGQGRQGQGGGQGQGGQPQGNPWQPGAGADQAWKSSPFASNPFLNTLVGQESGGGQNIVSRTDTDSQGRTLAQGGNPNEISQGYFQIQNHPGGTWETYGKQAGIDLNKYPTPRSAPLDVQWQVAQLIPIREWGGATQRVLHGRGFNYSPNTPLGQVAQANGGVQTGKTPTGGSMAPTQVGTAGGLPVMADSQ